MSPTARATVLAWVACCWAPACSLDVAALEGDQAAGTGAPTGGPISGPSAETAVEIMPPKFVSNSGDGDGDSEPPKVLDVPEGVTCGLIGLPCCRPDNRCDVGACLRGECAAFAGVFSQLHACGDMTACADRGIYSAGCACPVGFITTSMMAVQAPCADGSLGNKVVSACQAARTDASAWGGLWLRVDGAACGQACPIPNPYTGECACPAGQGTVAAPVTLGEPMCDGASGTLGLCVQGDAAGDFFGGGFLLASGSGNGCAATNPQTGQCTCAPGTTAQSVTVGPGVTMVFCNR